LTSRVNKLRAALRAADNEAIGRAASAVTAEVAYADGAFASVGYPDQWSDWERAGDDARVAAK